MSARLLSNVTIAPLVPYLRPLEVTVGEYGSLIFELLDPGSTAASAATTHVLCVFDTDTLLGEAFYDPSAPQQADAFLDALEAFCSAHSGKTVVTHTFCASTARPRATSDVLGTDTLPLLEQRLNDRLRAVANGAPNLVLVDLGLIYRRYGEETLTSSAFWYSGRIRFTNPMFRALGSAIGEALAAYGNRARKVLVLDLDDTLWGGIVGETGASGVTLSEDGRGAAFRDFQRAVRALKATGVLLAICSKNNPSDVEEVFSNNAMMVLRLDDFVAVRINWRPKPENLADIAHELNLGLSSFVFLDDNPVERALVSQLLPEVAVPTFPERVDKLSRWFVDAVVGPYFGKYRITGEDAAKTEQYRANDARRQLATTIGIDRFLEELEIVCTVRVDDPSTIVRASQMSQKTNQFNLTTLRAEVPEITRYAASPDLALVVLDYADRFGTEGSVALALVDLTKAHIVNFLMSCRVIGRHVEATLLERIIELLRARGATRVTGSFVPSRKNEIAATFYDQQGFTLERVEEDGTKRYERAIG